MGFRVYIGLNRFREPVPVHICVVKILSRILLVQTLDFHHGDARIVGGLISGHSMQLRDFRKSIYLYIYSLLYRVGVGDPGVGFHNFWQFSNKGPIICTAYFKYML